MNVLFHEFERAYSRSGGYLYDAEAAVVESYVYFMGTVALNRVQQAPVDSIDFHSGDSVGSRHGDSVGRWAYGQIVGIYIFHACNCIV